MLADFLILSLAAVNVISFCTSFYVLASHEIEWNAQVEDIIMNNVARLHVYIAQMFSQFKENMEIYQGILNGPITKKKLLKD